TTRGRVFITRASYAQKDVVEADPAAGVRPVLPDDRSQPRHSSSGVPRRAGLSAVARRGGEIQVLRHARIHQSRRREAPADRRDPPDTCVAPQTLDRVPDGATLERHAADPLALAKRLPVAREAGVSYDEEHRHL